MRLNRASGILSGGARIEWLLTSINFVLRRCHDAVGARVRPDRSQRARRAGHGEAFSTGPSTIWAQRVESRTANRRHWNTEGLT